MGKTKTVSLTVRRRTMRITASGTFGDIILSAYARGWLERDQLAANEKRHAKRPNKESK